MLLYNASLSNGLRNFARYLTKTDTTTYTNADLDGTLNMYYHTLINDIIESMDDWEIKGETATASLVANQQEYLFPTDILKIKRIEVTYDGTNWYKVEPLDISERSRPLDATSINNDFATTEPFYDAYDASLFLFPIPTSNVTGGLKIWYEKEATELSAVTDEPVIMEAYQKGLCYGAAKDYFERNLEVAGNSNKRAQMEKNLNLLRAEMKAFYNQRQPDREYIIKTNYVDWEYGYDN